MAVRVVLIVLGLLFLGGCEKESVTTSASSDLVGCRNLTNITKADGDQRQSSGAESREIPRVLLAFLEANPSIRLLNREDVLKHPEIVNDKNGSLRKAYGENVRAFVVTDTNRDGKDDVVAVVVRNQKYSVIVIHDVSRTSDCTPEWVIRDDPNVVAGIDLEWNRGITPIRCLQCGSNETYAWTGKLYEAGAHAEDDWVCVGEGAPIYSRADLRSPLVTKTVTVGAAKVKAVGDRVPPTPGHEGDKGFRWYQIAAENGVDNEGFVQSTRLIEGLPYCRSTIPAALKRPSNDSLVSKVYEKIGHSNVDGVDLVEVFESDRSVEVAGYTKDLASLEKLLVPIADGKIGKVIVKETYPSKLEGKNLIHFQALVDPIEGQSASSEPLEMDLQPFRGPDTADGIQDSAGYSWTLVGKKLLLRGTGEFSIEDETGKRHTLRLPYDRNQWYVSSGSIGRYDEDILLLFETEAGPDVGDSYVCRLNGSADAVRWCQAVPTFNVSAATSRQSILVGGIGFVARLNPDTGKYFWRWGHLYEPRSEDGGAFEFVAPFSESDVSATFEAKDTYGKITNETTSRHVTLDLKTGLLLLMTDARTGRVMK